MTSIGMRGSSARGGLDFHTRRCDATLREDRQFGKPLLHVGHVVVRLEVVFRGKHLEEHKMPWILAILLEKVDKILRIATYEGDQRQRPCLQRRFK